MFYDELWEPFTGRPFTAKGETRIRVTLDQRNGLYLNKGAFLALGEPRAVELLFSKKLNAIAIKPSDLQNESSFPVQPRRTCNGTAYGYIIRAAAFMHHHKLKVAGMVQFNKITVMPNGMMHLPITYLTRVSKGAK